MAGVDPAEQGLDEAVDDCGAEAGPDVVADRDVLGERAPGPRLFVGEGGRPRRR